MRLARMFVAIALLTLVAPAVLGDDVLVKELEKSQAKFLKAVEGLSEAQWNYKPAPDRWSIAQCAEHIAATEPFVRALLDKALQTPAAEEALKEAKKDEMIVKFMPDRSKRFPAPEPLQASGRYESGAAAVESFKKDRAETIELAATDTDFRKFAMPHPAFGNVDGYGWLLIMSGHTERHTLQIEEVKASEGYPKN